MNISNMNWAINLMTERPNSYPCLAVACEFGTDRAMTPGQWLGATPEQAAYLFAPERTIAELQSYADDALLTELFA